MSRHGRRGSIWDYTAASSGGIYRVIKSASGWSLTRKGTQLRSLANGLLATDEFPPRLSSGRGLPKSLLNDSWLEGRAFEALLSDGRSEEHTSELQSLMRISYAVFCLKQKN